MNSEYLASVIQYENRKRARAREKNLLHDILADSDAAGLTHSASPWQFPHIGALLWTLVAGVIALISRR